LTEIIHIRFAVGTFDDCLQLQNTTDDLRRRGLVSEEFSYLASPRAFRADFLPADVQVMTLDFPDAREPVSCTAGPLCDCLRERVAAGARNLGEALGHWLVPRHAAHFQHMVDQRKIHLWIKLARTDDERSAYESLLANSSNSVGVHDLTLTTPKNGLSSISRLG
jgi:hypothetical protein